MFPDRQAKVHLVCGLMSGHSAGRSSELALLDHLPMQFTFGNLVVHKKKLLSYVVK